MPGVLCRVAQGCTLLQMVMQGHTVSCSVSWGFGQSCRVMLLCVNAHSHVGTEADFLEQVPAVLCGALVIPAFSHNTMLVDSHSHVGVVAGFS